MEKLGHQSTRTSVPTEFVSDENVQRWTTLYGEQADRWLDNLPEHVASYAEKWELDIEEPLEGGTASVVVSAMRHNEPTVLKIHPPWMPQAFPTKTSAETEAAAFKLWDGECAPKLLTHDKQALLLEYVAPAHHSPDMTTQDMVDVVRQIARPIDLDEISVTKLGIPFMSEEVARRFNRAAVNRVPGISFEAFYVAWHFATKYSSPFIMPEFDFVLSHGDLKGKNILRRPDGTHAVIDPSPAIGSILFDATLWTIDSPEGILTRCQEVAECLKVDPQLVGSLALALAVAEICLASPERSAETLHFVRGVAGTSDLKTYFMNSFEKYRFMDNFVEIEPIYAVTDKGRRMREAGQSLG